MDQDASNKQNDVFGARAKLEAGGTAAYMYRLSRLEELGLTQIERLPFSIRVLLENLLRSCDGYLVTEDHVRTVAAWQPDSDGGNEIPYMPSRVILQDFTGVPAVADLAAMRSAMKAAGGDPAQINPLIPSDLVIDHSVQVDFFGSAEAFLRNVEREFERNEERYAFLKWAQKAFRDFSVVPPGMGIVHQVNLEYLANVVQLREVDGERLVYPDTLVGTDSHTTMINGLGVLGWGVGGIEAEAVMLGQPYYMGMPQVVGFKLTGELPEGATATDLVLTVTEMLRAKGVVGKFVEFYGSGLSKLPLPDRATIANMAPEYGATMGFFPVDQETLNYMRATGRPEELVAMVERYCKEQSLFRTDEIKDPTYTDTLELDMGIVQPSLAGPRRPQDRVLLGDMQSSFRKALSGLFGKEEPAPSDGERPTDGSVVIAAITSCTNTSNPSVMVGAGLLAKKAVEKGIQVKPWVKTSLAPGSRVVTDYLKNAGLLEYLEQLRFHVVGYGCTTCIGNSGQLPSDVAEVVEENDLVAAAVLSGNRNFEGRINPLVRANYLASPVLVVAYALAGTVDIDLVNEPLGKDQEGNPVYLKDIWPSQDEIRRTIDQAIKPESYTKEYAGVFAGDEQWQALPAPVGALFAWDGDSTYIQEPPFFTSMSEEPNEGGDIHGARVLALLGDSITTDHISPAGAIPKNSPAGEYLQEHGVEPVDFNTFGSRRGNHEVMMRGTFGNIRLKNELVPGVEGGVTRHFPSNEECFIYDASMRYQKEGTPLVVIAGKEYGTGSSRDWAAKGTFLLGVKAVIAESYERIHRSNLVGMGVLPLQFKPGESRTTHGLTGEEVYEITGLSGEIQPGQEVTVRASVGDQVKTFKAVVRLDSPVEVNYYRNGGILQTVLRRLLSESRVSKQG